MSQRLAIVAAQFIDGIPTIDLTFVPPFMYSLPWGLDEPWSDDAVLRIVADDGSETHEFHKSDGQPVGDFIVFTFNKSRADVRYRGSIVDGSDEFPLFGAVEIRRIQMPNDSLYHLPLPDPSAAAGGDADPAPASNPAPASGGSNGS